MKRYIHHGSAFVLGALFLFAGLVKLWDPIVLTEDIRRYQMVPDPIPALAALFLPWVEILAGLAVLTGVFRRGGLVLLIGSLVVFLGANLYAALIGLDLTCGCFGDWNRNSGPGKMAALNAGLLLLSGLVIFTMKTKAPPDSDSLA
jgi:putative oxidoreductase